MNRPVQIRFDDGAAYERMMGTWSRIAGADFLDWLAVSPGLRWLDVGCGNGAFTELVADRCAPAEIEGIDPSEGQIAYARGRPAARLARFGQGDAMALPFADARFDVAVMALVIFFVPEPARAVAEMARVVRPGGTVAAYAWDIHGGGFPLHPVQEEMRAIGVTPLLPPSADASRIDAMRALWTAAGLESVRTREIVAHRSFESFDEFWAIGRMSSSVGAMIGAMTEEDRERLRSRVKARMPVEPDGSLKCSARANAVTGRVPG